MKHLRAIATTRAARWAAIAALGCTLSCVDMAPYSSLEVRTAGADPDALYAATIRVLIRRGLGIMMTDRSSREIRTQWFRFRDIGIGEGSAGTDYAGSFRVTFHEDTVQVFTACDWVNDFDRLSRFQACPDGQRPEGLHDREMELVGAIMDEARSARVAAAAAKSAYADPPAAFSRPAPVSPPVPPPPPATLTAPPPPAATPPAPSPLPASTPPLAVASVLLAPPAQSAAPEPAASVSPEPAASVSPEPAASVSPVSAGVAGCSSDLECKGDRVCADHMCVDAMPDAGKP
jgi:hypothetical protein